LIKKQAQQHLAEVKAEARRMVEQEKKAAREKIRRAEAEKT
jgi:hypothetical protein